MPAPRESSAVTCSCGQRWGDLRRATAHDEDAVEVELAKLRDKVPLMLRHWTLRHELTVNPRAPLAVKAMIAKAARELAASDETAGEPPPRRQLHPDDPA